MTDPVSTHTAAPKPFKGVISNWWREDLGDCEIVNGICEWHRDQEAFALHTPRDPIAQHLEMHTSRVVKIDNRGAYAICETKNSIYVLVRPRATEAP